MRIKNPDELEFDAFCKRFDIHGSTKSYIDIKAFFDKSLKKELNNNGYVILRNVVSLEILEEI